MLKIAVAATAPFGADVLERLAAEHDVALLVTRPDRPRGRGRKGAAPAAKETARRLGIPVAQPARLDPGNAIPAPPRRAPGRRGPVLSSREQERTPPESPHP